MSTSYVTMLGYLIITVAGILDFKKIAWSCLPMWKVGSKSHRLIACFLDEEILIDNIHLVQCSSAVLPAQGWVINIVN